ncbi:MAG: metallophosphoesterase [Deltaproteobacteria bacterium]|nr:metallophosphoesterase [Deltaproteobacteria bacterium]
MPACFFATDLHGDTTRWGKLFAAAERERPAALFLGGDLLPGGFGLATMAPGHRDFVDDFLVVELRRLRAALGGQAPRVFAILGNDDPRIEEAAVRAAAAGADPVWEYVHDRRVAFGRWAVYGYAYAPPSPFPLKDWERYDVSRYVDPGAVSPEEGMRTVPVSEAEAKWSTIQGDLRSLAGTDDLSDAILLCHAPPYDTPLDRAALDGRQVEHVPLDVHVGSIALRRFIEARQPLVTLHGHVHEAVRLTGEWRVRLGRTWAFGGAHDGPELALVRFDPDDPGSATRELL